MPVTHHKHFAESDTGSTVSMLTRPKNGQDAVDFVENVWGFLKDTKRGHEHHWKEALLFLASEQWIRYVSATRSFMKHHLERWVPTPVTNKCGQVFDRLLDIFTSGDYVPHLIPATDDQADINASVKAERVLHFLGEELQTSDTMDEAAASYILFGNILVSSFWDPRSGLVTRIPQMSLEEEAMEAEPASVCPMCDADFDASFRGQVCPACRKGILMEEPRELLGPDGQPLSRLKERQERDESGNLKYEEYRLGQVGERVIDVFKYYPQPKQRWRDVQYAIEAEVLTRDEVVDQFGSKFQDVAGEEIRTFGWGSFLSSAPSSGFFNDETNTEPESVIVKHFRHLPGSKFKEGSYIITVGGRTAHMGPIDSDDGTLGVEHCGYRKLPGEMWGGSIFRDIIPLQKRLNSIDSTIIWNRKTMVSPQWVIPTGSGISHIDGRPSLIIRYNWRSTGGREPRKEPGTPLPPQVLQEREMVKSEIEELSGTNDVLQGTPPGRGAESGVAMNLLMEQGLRRFGPPVKRWRRMWARHERRKLIIARDHWDEPRLVKVVGENEVVETYHYSAADFRSAADAYVRMEGEVVHSQAMIDARVERAAEKGFLGDVLNNPELRARVLEVMRIPGFSTDYTPHAKKARRNIWRVMNRNEFQIQASPFDLHPIHLKIYSDFMTTSEFEEAGPEAQKAIFMLAQQHAMIMQQQAMAAAANAQRTRGSGPEATKGVSDAGGFGSANAQTQETVAA